MVAPPSAARPLPKDAIINFLESIVGDVAEQVPDSGELHLPFSGKRMYLNYSQGTFAQFIRPMSHRCFLVFVTSGHSTGTTSKYEGSRDLRYAPRARESGQQCRRPSHVILQEIIYVKSSMHMLSL